MVLNIGFNLEKEKINIQNILLKLTQENLEKNNSINNIIKNLQFIKDQNNCIISCLKGKGIEKTDSVDFSKELEGLTRTIKNLKLDPDNQKIESTPPIYKHWKPKK